MSNQTLDECQQNLAVSCLPMAHKIASKATGDGERCHDLAIDALMAAARNFDPDKGFRFTTYAYVAVARRMKQSDRFKPFANHSVRAINLNSHLQWMLYDVEEPEQDNPLPPDDECKRLWKAVRKLPARERGVIKALYVDDVTVTALAKRMGLSKQRVSQLRDRALKQLRMILGER